MCPHFFLRQLVALGGRRACEERLLDPGVYFICHREEHWCLLGYLRSETYVALAADHLVAVVLGGKGLEGRLNDTTTETEDQVESGFLKGGGVS